MSAVRVIGVDPGPTPGVVRLVVEGGQLVDVAVVQCSASALLDLLVSLVGETEGRLVVAVERFVARGRASADQRLTADQVMAITQQLHGRRAVVQRPAAQVKPWATDERLQRAGLLEACKGMRHARDAARHALYAAARDGGLADPLSSSWQEVAR